MDYPSTLTFQSEYDPQITVVLHKPSYGRRINLDKMTAEFRSNVARVRKEYKLVSEQLDAMEREFYKTHAIEDATFQATDEILDKLNELNAESNRATAFYYNPQLLRWGVKSITGLMIDGQEADVDALIQEGPSDLVHEIINRIEQARGLTGEELKNSSLPSISAAVADGKTSDTTATSVLSTDSSAPATVESQTSPPITT